MASKLLIFSGTSFYNALKEIMESGEHFFPPTPQNNESPYTPQNNEPPYSIICVDTEEHYGERIGGVTYFGTNIGRGKNNYEDLSQASEQNNNTGTNIGNGKNNYEDLSQASKQNNNTDFIENNFDAFKFILNYIKNDDKEALNQYEPGAGGAGAKWEGGFYAFFDVIHLIKPYIERTILNSVNTPSDIIISGGAMGGTKSGFIIPLLFNIAYFLTQKYKDSFYQVRVHVLLSIPDRTLDTYRINANKIVSTYKNNANKVLYYTNKFLRLMKDNKRINTYVYLFLPALSEEYDMQKIVRFASYLCNKDVSTKLVDISQNLDSNYITIYSEEFFLPMNCLINTFANKKIELLTEKQLKDINEREKRVSARMKQGAGGLILKEKFEYKLPHRRTNVQQPIDWIKILNTVVVNNVIQEIISELNKIGGKLDNDFDNDFSDSDLEFVKAVNDLVKNKDKYIKVTISFLEQKLQDKFSNVNINDFQQHFENTRIVLDNGIDKVKNSLSSVTKKIDNYSNALSNFKSIIGQMKTSTSDVCPIILQNIFAENNEFPSSAQGLIENAFKEYLRKQNFHDGRKEIINILSTNYFFANDQGGVPIINIRGWIINTEITKIESFAEKVWQYTTNPQGSYPPLYTLSPRKFSTYIFLYSNYKGENRWDEIIRNLKNNRNSYYEQLSSNTQTIMSTPPSEKEEGGGFDQIKNMYFTQKGDFVFKLGLFAIVTFESLDKLQVVRNGYYKI